MVTFLIGHPVNGDELTDKLLHLSSVTSSILVFANASSPIEPKSCERVKDLSSTFPWNALAPIEKTVEGRVNDWRAECHVFSSMYPMPPPIDFSQTARKASSPIVVSPSPAKVIFSRLMCPLKACEPIYSMEAGKLTSFKTVASVIR